MTAWHYRRGMHHTIKSSVVFWPNTNGVWSIVVLCSFRLCGYYNVYYEDLGIDTLRNWWIKEVVLTHRDGWMVGVNDKESKLLSFSRGGKKGRTLRMKVCTKREMENVVLVGNGWWTKEVVRLPRAMVWLEGYDNEG